MININDVITSLTQIYNVLENVEVKGNDNLKYILYAQQKSNELKEQFSVALKQFQNGGTEQEQNSVDPEQPEQEGEANGEQDTGVSG